jgi:hypothetical protein
MNRKRGARAERLRDAEVIVAEARIGSILVVSGDDADALLLKDERDHERRHATSKAGADLFDLGIVQKGVDALALPAR